MNRLYRSCLLVCLGSLLPALAGAQTPREWKTTLSGSKSAPVTAGDLGFGTATKHPYPSSGITWIISCSGAISCTKLVPMLLQAGSSPGTVDTLAINPAPGTPPSEAMARFVVFGRKEEGTLLLALDGTDPAAVTLQAAVVLTSSRTDAAVPGAFKIDGSCPDADRIAQRPESAKDTGFIHHFYVDYLGNVLARPTYPVDDRSRVLVTVLAKKDAVPRLRVNRISAFRSVGTINLVGQEVDASKFIPHSEGVVEMSCRPFILSDFAAGKGEVEIAVVSDEGKAERLGTFDFAVNPTYTGALSFGAIRTPLLDPDIGLAFTGSDTVITARTDGIQGQDSKAHRILYTVSYTYFMWGRRDIEKPRPVWERFNPMMGVVLNDIPNNFIAGVTFDLFDGVFVSGGAHAGKVHTLDPTSGLSFGDHFAGEAKDIPIRRSWKTRWFVGVAIDLRAASQLFRAVLGAG